MQSLVDFPACTGANPKRLTFSVKRISAVASGEGTASDATSELD